MKTTIACLILLLSCGAHAQSNIPAFGHVEPAELAMKTCAFEPGAAALNLIRTASVTIGTKDSTGDPSVTTVYRIRIKIFDKRGFSAANVKIPYGSEEGSTMIKDIEACIYRLGTDGGVTREKVERKDIFTDSSKAANALNSVAFTFPDLNDGAVIEYKYTRVDKHSIAVNPWLFQDEFPTAYSNVVVSIPFYAYMDYHIVSAGIVAKDSSLKAAKDSLLEDVRSFTMQNVHSFKREPLMYSLSDNLERIEFSVTLASYLHSNFLSNAEKLRYYNFSLLWSRYFGYQFDRPLKGAKRFIDSVRKLPSIEDRIAMVYGYIAKNIAWNGEHTLYCESVERCWTKKSGSQAEINILFLDLLRRTGVKCLPLLVSTHNNGNPDHDFPTMAQFNGVDVFVRDVGMSYIVDCTQKDLSYKIPPYNVLNSNAYIIDPDLKGWTFILDNRILMKAGMTINGVMDSSGLITGLTTAAYTGFGKKAVLDGLDKKEDKTAQEAEALANTDPGLTTDSTNTDNAGVGNDSLLQKIYFHYLPSNTDKLYFLDPTLFFNTLKNPFKDPTRYTDVDFGCNQSMSTQMRIQLPANFSVESLPNSMTLYKNDSTICFERKLSIEDRYLLISHSLTIKKTIYIKEDYAELKSFFDKFYALTSEQILLKKH